MTRVFSGIQPSGSLHIGNYVGALRQWVVDQSVDDAYFCVVDLHALTTDTSPELITERTTKTAVGLLAVGLDPAKCTIFLQSHVPEHAELAWILECNTSFGELRRMTQFKEKSADQKMVRAGLFTYPVLMAADILIYDTDKVPVGDDQRQHLELTRDLALRFNANYGETFVVPQADVPKVGARVMDLQRPDKKMSKSTSTEAGLISIDDSPDEIRKKIRRAVTDTETEVRFDPDQKPGVSNLLELLAAARGDAPASLAERYSSYGALKDDTAEAVIELLAPIRLRHTELEQDPEAVRSVLEKGAETAQSVARKTLARARHAVGLVERR
ncbi:MAG TPA: tryptophan--tRNA ligase [Acidimicrobiales bacterium]|nr:tryptophan--tRNA ligase [Acidimicrobiales bacterium]